MSSLPDLSLALCLLLIFMIPLAAAGLSLTSSGLVRSSSAAHTMLSGVCVFAVTVIVYSAVGFSLQSAPGLASHAVIVSGKNWDWAGAAGVFYGRLDFNGSAVPLAVLLQLFATVLTGMIPLGTGAERWRLTGVCVSTAVLAGFVYPVFGHWAWDGGWLTQLGVNGRLGQGFVDYGGAGTVHCLGAMTALAIGWRLGPRRGKYTDAGLPTATPGHNAVIVLFGCGLVFLGCTGLNAAGSLLFAGIGAGRCVLVILNCALAASGSALAAALVTRVRFGKPDASLTANGWVAGLVAVSAGCAFFKPVEALLIGIMAGGAIPFAVEFIELRLKVDDPAGAISVHGVGGMWGLLAAGLFAHLPEHGANGGGQGQLIAQLTGMATLLGFILPLVCGLVWAVGRIVPQRVPADGEREGMDLFELGAGAYPDFATSSDDFRAY